MPDLENPEDLKLVTLARGARGRVGADEGAAVRDETGRTYSGATVALTGLEVTAACLAVAQAAASGAKGLECVVVITREGVRQSDVVAARALGGSGVPVIICNPRGEVVSRLTT